MTTTTQLIEQCKELSEKYYCHARRLGEGMIIYGTRINTEAEACSCGGELEGIAFTLAHCTKIEQAGLDAIEHRLGILAEMIDPEEESDYPASMTLSEIIERGYLYDCKVSRLKANPVLKLTRVMEEDGSEVPHYSDIWLDL